MKVEYINPFVAATVDVFRTMLSCSVTRQELRFTDPSQPMYDVSGVIGLSGDASGVVVLSIDKEVAFCAAEALLGEKADEVDADVVDMVGELANMIAGAAKAELEEFNLSVSLPSVIVGKDHVIGFPSQATPICIPFESPWGPLRIDVSLIEEALPAVAAR